MPRHLGTFLGSYKTNIGAFTHAMVKTATLSVITKAVHLLTSPQKNRHSEITSGVKVLIIGLKALT